MNQIYVQIQSEKQFTNAMTASNTIEAMRILMESTLSVVWDQELTTYLSTSGAGGEDVLEKLSL